MGRYLTTNLNISIQYDKSKADERMSKAKTGFDVITKDFIGNTEWFDFKEDEQWYLWRIKPQVLEDNFYKLMERYFNDFYATNSYYSKDGRETLEALKEIKHFDEIIAYAKEHNYSTLSYNNSWDYYYSGYPPRQEYLIKHFMIAVEGKLEWNESIYGHTSFFNKLLREKYADNPLGSCFSVNIWG